jgi:hypothetical protein
MNVRDILPSKWAIAAVIGCIVLLPTSVYTAHKWGVEAQGRVRAEGSLKAEKATNQGLMGKLASCQAQLGNAQGSLEFQNQRIQQLVEQGENARRQAEARLATERAKTRAAEAARRTLLQEQMRDGETPCDAAWRLHKENIG